MVTVITLFVYFLVALHILFGLQVNAGQSTLAAYWKSDLLCEMVHTYLCVTLVVATIILSYCIIHFTICYENYNGTVKLIKL